MFFVIRSNPNIKIIGKHQLPYVELFFNDDERRTTEEGVSSTSVDFYD
jgi:hypothetical protein